MVWLLVALILGSIGFAVSTIMKYKTTLDELQPRLNRARKSAERLEKAVEAETTLKHKEEEERDGLARQANEHKAKIAEIHRKISEAEKEQEELEMAMYKKEFRKGR